DRLQGNWSMNLNQPIHRLGMHEINQLYFGRSRHSPSSVELTFKDDEGNVVLKVSCESGPENIKIELHWKTHHVKERNPDTEGLIKRLYRIQVNLIPPLGTLSPTEEVMPWPILQNELAQGRHAETWRNQLHWLTEGKSPEQFQRVKRVIHDYLGDV